MLTFAVRSWTATLFIALLAIATLVPMATQGHSGEEANHSAAVMALALHIIAAAAWLGGLLLVIAVRPIVPRERIAVILTRYSSIALVAFIVVAVSGYARAAIGVGAWDQLATPYGLLVLVKVGALLVLGVLGAWYRRRLIAPDGRGAGHPAASGRLIAVELAFMGIASGAAAALARTAPPASGALPSSARPPRC